MQKKFIVAALAVVFSTPVLADTANVTVYGVLHTDWESVKNDKAAAATSLSRVVSNASRLGFKGSEDLGDGLSAIYQIESQVDLTGAAGNTFNAPRNSNVGLTGNFGTAFLGFWDTPYKVIHNKVELFDNTHIASSLDLTGRVGATQGGANFNTRQKNVIQYWTPNYQGFQAKVAYAPDAAKAATIALGGDKAVFSISTVFENDQFFAGYGYETHRDAKSTVVSLTDTASRLVGAYKFTDGQVGLTYERIAVAPLATSVSTLSRTGWELSAKYKLGSSNLGAFYSSVGNLGGVAATGAKQYSFRYGYNLSKRTELYGFYTALHNDTAASYNFSANNTVASAAGVAGNGAKLSGFGIGLAHSF